MNTAQKSFRRRLGENWFFMTTAPWERIEMTNYNRKIHIFTYIIGWLWILSGIIVGSLLSQPLLDNLQLRNTIWETPISIGIAVGVGFLVQFIGWLLLIPLLTRENFRSRVGPVGIFVGAVVSQLSASNTWSGGAYGIGVLFPIVLSGFCIYVLFHYFGVNYDFTNRTVLYSVLVKAIIYPAIGKVLAVIGFGHFFTGIKTAIKVYEE